jgi:FkbM family methyltransferase
MVQSAVANAACWRSIRVQGPQESFLKRSARFLRTRQRFWREYLYSGEAELRQLSNYVDPQRLAIDVGANVGLYTYHLSRLARHVHTFEPNEHYVNIVRNLGLSNVSIEEFALSRSNGKVELRIPRVGDGREDFGMASLEAAAVSDEQLAQKILIETRTLDSFNFADVGFIKIDVEGHEEGVLDGAMETISHSRPTILAEIEERHNLGGIWRIAEKLGELGYEASFFVDGQKTSLDQFKPEIHQRVTPELDGGGHSRRAIAYFNNFLFQFR